MATQGLFSVQRRELGLEHVMTLHLGRAIRAMDAENQLPILSLTALHGARQDVIITLDSEFQRLTIPSLDIHVQAV